MRRLPKAISRASWISGAPLLAAIVLAGCGGSSSGGSTTSGSSTGAVGVHGSGGSIKRSAVRVPRGVAIPLTSSAIEHGQLPARYTCDGANIAPALKWGTVPPTSTEVVLVALGAPSAHSSTASGSVEWVMAGLKPELHGVGAGELPSGAFLVEGSNGKRKYSICPGKGQTGHYRFAIYAMPPLISVGKAINGPKLLQNLTHGSSEDLAPGTGQLPFTYTRG
jgi:phosphatidylethanolamine-binding protein (PEBP) family uncharacterized protein